VLVAGCLVLGNWEERAITGVLNYTLCCVSPDKRRILVWDVVGGLEVLGVFCGKNRLGVSSEIRVTEVGSWSDRRRHGGVQCCLVHLAMGVRCLGFGTAEGRPRAVRRDGTGTTRPYRENEHQNQKRTEG